MKIKQNVAISQSGFAFNPTSGDSFSLNPMATEIFNLLKEQKTETEIAQLILAKYEIDEYTFQRDFDDFKQMLKHYQFIDE